jgi:ADP-heptose:LPS heptosyltransferase/SAM-dependent methyltransferase
MENRALKDHNLFKPKNLEEGKHAVVGDCNGFTMQQRWEAETHVFARKILGFVKDEAEILDYGCGVGRLAKEILRQSPSVFVTGLDASADMRAQAEKYVEHVNFSTVAPRGLKSSKFDLVYLVYVLQHVPAIEIREILARIHYHLKENGILVYCSSDFRMAIRYDGQGFFDDSFLGVDLRAEVDRYFDIQGPLFSDDDFRDNPVLKKMITGCDGSLAHPAFVYKKKKIFGPVFDAAITKEEGNGVLKGQEGQEEEISARMEARSGWDKSKPKKILILNRLCPGDILVMTNAIRDLHLAHPGEYITDIRTPCNDIFDNSPYITKLQYDEKEYSRLHTDFQNKERWKKHPKDNTEFLGDIMVLDAHYPLIHKSGVLGSHFSEGHTKFLEEALGVLIPQTDLRPQIFLSQDEATWPSPALVAKGVEEKYWIINAGSKNDMALKQYPYYQEVVDLLSDKIRFVQAGVKGHNHIPLNGVVDMVGQTNVRELCRLIHKAEGVLTCVSFPMHLAAAFHKPCVVVAGAREGTRWELYPNHQFIYVNGCLLCATYDGCWRGGPDDCNNKKNNVPRCMLLIRPEDVAWAVTRYYEGGMLEYDPSRICNAEVGRA